MRFADPSGEAGKDIADWLDRRVNYSIDFYRQQFSRNEGDSADVALKVIAAVTTGGYDFLRLGEGLYDSYEAAENGDYLSAALYAGQDVLRGLQIVSFGVHDTYKLELKGPTMRKQHGTRQGGSEG